jgi:uncharacterized protein
LIIINIKPFDDFEKDYSYSNFVSNIMKKNFVLITGASSGLGLEFAQLAASKNYNLVLIARRQKELARISETLSLQHKIIVHTLEKDLSLTSSAQEIFKEVSERLNLEIDVLINNAGFGTNGQFHLNSFNTELDQIRVNVLSLVALTRLFIPGMIERDKGIILNVASTAAYQPGPYMSVYYATKAFVKNFSLGLNFELRKTNVKVTLFAPGPTRTEFQKRANMKESIITNEMLMMDAPKAAKMGFEGALKGKKEIIPGFKNKLGVLAVKLLPEFIITRIVSKVNKNRINK